MSLIGDVSKGRDNPESRDAFKKIERRRSLSITKIVNLLRIEGPMTCKELSEKMDVPIHHVSGRISEGKAMGLIEKTGERRDGAAVVRALGGRQAELAL